MTIAIIDYGAGNLLSITRAITQAGGEAVVAQTAEAVERADAVVLPGVGAAGSAMRALEASGIAAVLRRRVPAGLPLLGICLGMQLCFDWLDEGDCAGLGFIPGRVTRMTPFPGGKIPHMGWNTITWDAATDLSLLQGISSGSYAYFVHSYRCELAPDADVGVAWTEYGERMCAVVGARPHLANPAGGGPHLAGARYSAAPQSWALLPAAQPHPPTPSPFAMERGSPNTSLHSDGEELGVRPPYTIWGTQFHPEKSGDAGLTMVRNFVALSQKVTQPMQADFVTADAAVAADPATGSSTRGAERLTIYPAIDLLGGKCVRLLHGEYDKVTTYDGDPLDAARRWRDQGATWLHIIDLDGARQGAPAHLEVVARIVGEIGLPVRLGGGMRNAADVAAAFAAGVRRVTLGTAALDVDLLRALVAQWGDGIEIALDRRGDEVAVAGWQASAKLTAREWVRQAVAAGVRAFLVTDIRRDGALTGANVDLVAQTRADAGDTPIEITVAGGVATVDDIRQLAQAGANGAVIGRALYDGRITLPAALAAAQEQTPC